MDAVTETARKYLTFSLAGELFGIDILDVKEIVQVPPVTSVPRAEKSIRGVINLRGTIIPVVELRTKLGFKPATDSDKTCIVVVQIQTKKGLQPIGLLVDEVAEVFDFGNGDIAPPPDFGVGNKAILGMGKRENSIVMLLDIAHILAGVAVPPLEQMKEAMLVG